MKAVFKDAETAQKYGVEPGAVGDIVAMETRDKEQYVVVRFPGVEINGVPAEFFDITQSEGVE